MVAATQEIVRKRGFVGQIFKWIFIIFNVLMLFVVVGMFAEIGDASTAALNDAERAGVAIGGSMAMGTLLVFWAIVSAILGMLVLTTRGRLQVVHTAPQINVSVVNQLGTAPQTAAIEPQRRQPQIEFEDERDVEIGYQLAPTKRDRNILEHR